MTPDQGYKTRTVLTLILGLSSIVGIFLMSLIFGEYPMCRQGSDAALPVFKERNG